MRESRPSTPPRPGERVLVFDTTLRDGEQSPGATMTSSEKLDVARALARLRVDVIEAGFPAASPDDARAVQTIAAEVGVEGGPIVCGLARATENDIRVCAEAIAPAARGRIHTFLATSPIHREHKLRMSKREVLRRVREMVGFARARCEDVEFSAEDAGRTELPFLAEVAKVAIDAGATTINVPDTVGYVLPHELAEKIAYLRANVPGIEDVVLSVHCHDDLGLAVANSLAGVAAGARQVEVAINGIGERAGNASLEEVVMAIRTRKDALRVDTRVVTQELVRASRLVSRVTGMAVQPNKAIVGANAFAHESGIHQDGMLKHEETYEIMRPETVGAGQTELVLGKHSGRHAFGARLEELGFPLEGEALLRAFERFKAVAEKKKQITDADLIALVADERHRVHETFRLEGVQVACGTSGMPTATVRIASEAGERVEACVGTGPVDAVFGAIDTIVGAVVELVEFQVQSVTAGIDALGEVSVRVRPVRATEKIDPQRDELQARRLVHGVGTDTDIVVASAKAYLSAINQVLAQTAPRKAA